MKMSRDKVITIFRALNSLVLEKMPPKGAYAIVKNKKIAEKENEIMEEAKKSVELPERMGEYDTKRIEVCKEYCLKDEEGNPLMGRDNNGQEIFQFADANRSKWNKELKELQVEYSEELKARKKIEDDFNELLAEEIEVNFHKIHIEHLPEQISVMQMDIISELITDEE